MGYAKPCVDDVAASHSLAGWISTAVSWNVCPRGGEHSVSNTLLYLALPQNLLYKDCPPQLELDARHGEISGAPIEFGRRLCD